MKKTLVALLLLLSISPDIYSQDDDVRGEAIGVSFIMNDFITPQRIRSGSLSAVFRNDQWAKLRDMAPGLSINYFRGLKRHVDFSASLSGSFVNIPLADKPLLKGDKLLVEVDATVNLKMFSDRYWFTPYLIAGVGASAYREYFGAYIPVGGGLKVNFFDEAALFITTQYRIPVTPETNNYHFMNSIGIASTIGKKREAAARPAP